MLRLFTSLVGDSCSSVSSLLANVEADDAIVGAGSSSGLGSKRQNHNLMMDLKKE